MDDFTRQQLRTLSLDFYQAQADAFDASRRDLPWPGWQRVVAALREGLRTGAEPLLVLDIGCGNGRFAHFLRQALTSATLDYTGVDASPALLAAAQARVEWTPPSRADFVLQDFLAEERPGRGLPEAEFALVVLMGVLHHVPSRAWREALLAAAAARLRPGGLLAFTAWQFADRDRYARQRIAWCDAPPIAGRPIDAEALDPGDHLLRFGADPDAAPRYCHQMGEAEFAAWPEQLGLTAVDTFEADGASGDANRYWLLQRLA